MVQFVDGTIIWRTRRLLDRRRGCHHQGLERNKSHAKQTQTVDEKINQLTSEQREQIGELTLSISREGLKEFPHLDPLDAIQMLDEMGL